MIHDIRVCGYRVRGDYTPERRNYGRGGPSDTPPEPAQFEVHFVYDEDGRDIADTLTYEELCQIEDMAVSQIRRDN